MPLQIEENKSLKDLTTFKIGGPAKFFAVAQNADELKEAMELARQKNVRLFVIGGGSNMLISDSGIDELVVHYTNKGIEILSEDDDFAIIKARAGEVWDDVVAFVVNKHWWGIENLSHIPGTAGGAIVQNIGAYGQQLSDVLQECEALNLKTGGTQIFKAEEFDFDYRKSIFNTSRRGEFAVLSITLKLSKKAQNPNLSYPDVQRYFEERKISELSVREIREAITTIRDSKYPFPKEEVGGNAGSFFKNLLLSEAEYQTLSKKISENFDSSILAKLEEIRNKFASAPSTTRKQGQIKIPTAFLIDICGLKGFQTGGIKVNDKQPLVLLNTGGAKASDVLKTVLQVRQTIFSKTGMEIQTEPELIGFTEQELKEAFALS